MTLDVKLLHPLHAVDTTSPNVHDKCKTYMREDALYISLGEKTQRNNDLKNFPPNFTLG